MQGDPNIKIQLNTALKIQLTAINQFFLHARMCKNWGLSSLNETIYKGSIKAMKQADSLIERILFLEGLPNLQDLGALRIGENVEEVLQNDLIAYQEMRSQLQDAVQTCESLQDYVSRELFEELLESTEEYIDWIESQQWLIANTGLQNYLQSSM